MRIRTMKGLKVVFAVAVLIGGSAWAQVGSKATQFDIPAGDLALALKAFGEQSDTDVLFDPKLTAQKRTAGLSGKHGTQEGLTLLLAQANLKFRVVGGKTVLIDDVDGAASGGVGAMQLTQAETDSSSPAAGEGAPKGADEGRQESAISEIVVTAQKREESLQDVPISIGVLSGTDLDRSSARGVADALKQVGGVSVVGTSPGETQISVRGITPAYGTSTTAFYIDEVPFTFITNSLLPDANAFDLERVEVLRGPQGTLYGANALGGVVRVLTNDANVDALEVKGRARASNTQRGSGNYAGDFAINVPLIPGTLAIRGVASHEYLSGYIDSSLTGKSDINDTKARAYRLKVNYKPNAQSNVRLTLSRSRIDNGAPSLSFDDLTTPLPGADDQHEQRVYDSYNLTADYHWSSVSLLSSTSYLDYSSDSVLQIGFRVPTHAGSRAFSQEVRLASRLQGPWQWSLGGFYKDTTEPFRQLAPALFGSIPFEIKPTSETYAIFAETARTFADGRFELTGGVRYYADSQVKPNTSNFGFSLAGTQSADFDGVTGRLVLSYKPQHNRSFYGSVATGFRGGWTVDAAAAATRPGFAPLDPDKLVTYEAGMKGAPLGGTFRYDVAVYYTDWRDIQQRLFLVGLPFTVGVNAGTASGPGVDLSFAYQPASALSLQASIGWNDLQFDQDVLSRGLPLFPKDGRASSSPEWTGSINAIYRFGTPIQGMQAFVSSGYDYRSALVGRALGGTATNPVIIPTQSEALRALNAEIGLERDSWSVTVYGDNLLDSRDSIQAPEVGRSLTSIRQRPRTIGLQATFKY